MNNFRIRLIKQFSFKHRIKNFKNKSNITSKGLKELDYFTTKEIINCNSKQDFIIKLVMKV